MVHSGPCQAGDCCVMILVDGLIVDRGCCQRCCQLVDHVDPRRATTGLPLGVAAAVAALCTRSYYPYRERQYVHAQSRGAVRSLRASTLIPR